MPPSQTDSDSSTATIDSFVAPDVPGDSSDEDRDTGESERESFILVAGVDDPAAVGEAAEGAFNLDSTTVEALESDVVAWVDDNDATVFRDRDRAVVCGSDRDACRAKLLQFVRSSDARDKVVLTDWLVYCEDDLASLSSFLAALLDAGAAVTAAGSDVLLSPGGSLDDTDAVALLGEISAAALDPREHPERQIEVLEHNWSGRTPIGTEVEHGALVPSQDWSRVRSHLLDVVEGTESRTWAANRIGCSLRTVSRILDDSRRREWYRLPAAGE